MESVEKEQERIVFFIDNIEDLIARLESDPALLALENDLFTVTEILQIYCTDSLFPGSPYSNYKSIAGFFWSAKTQTVC